MGPGDQALLVTHQPRWLSDWLHEEAGCHNLRQLVRGHLRGRARVHLAGARPPAPRGQIRDAPGGRAPPPQDGAAGCG